MDDDTKELCVSMEKFRDARVVSRVLPNGGGRVGGRGRRLLGRLPQGPLLEGVEGAGAPCHPVRVQAPQQPLLEGEEGARHSPGAPCHPVRVPAARPHEF